MIEFELKFQIPPSRRDAVRTFVGGRKPPTLRPVRLQAIYFDTPQRLLARSGIALRMRHEGSTGWVQTLKGSAPDGLGREEYNLPLEDDVDASNPPAIDLQRHRGVPLGEHLIRLLAADGDAGLVCSYRSDVRRLRRLLKTTFGTVELAFDEGRLISGGSRLAICELEIELIGGQPMAVVDVARRWALRFGLWLDIRSKAERGDLLARGQTVAEVQSVVARTKLHEQHSPRAALQASLAAVRHPILANASQIASGQFHDEHVHQLRVMLRRLRVLLRLYADDPAADALGRPLAEPAAELFRGLGAARDRTVLAGPIAADIDAALQQVGDEGALTLPSAQDAEARLLEMIRSAPTQQLLLSLIEATLPAVIEGPVTSEAGASMADAARSGVKLPAPAGLRQLLTHRLGRWQRSISRDAGRFSELDETARHRLRKHAKRLRYGIDAAESLLGKRKPKPIVKALKRAQAVLGDLNDLSTAIRVFGAAGTNDRRAWFARGWLIARRDALVASSGKPLKQLARVTRKKKLR